jgi:hypothetical protein
MYPIGLLVEWRADAPVLPSLTLAGAWRAATMHMCSVVRMMIAQSIAQCQGVDEQLVAEGLFNTMLRVFVQTELHVRLLSSK